MPFYKVKPKGGRKVHLIQESRNDAVALCGLKSPTGWYHVSVPVNCDRCNEQRGVRVETPPPGVPTELELENQGPQNG